MYKLHKFDKYGKYPFRYIKNYIGDESIMLVCIDPGHGGADSGAEGNGLLEKNINLDISLRQKALFEKLGHKVIMTRTTDVNHTLDERANISNQANADVCISNHVNDGGGKGFEVWHSIYGGKGQEYAQRVNIQMSKIMISRGLKTRQGANGDYLGMIRMPKAPAVLFEFGFIDNVDDTNKLKQESFRQQCAEAVVKGILNINEIPTPQPEQPTIWYRVLIDGVNLEANSTQEESETIVRTKINNGEGKLGQVQRNTDGAILYTYSKPVVVVPPPVVEPPKQQEPKHAIMGNAEISVEQAEQFLHKENPQAPYFAQIYKEEGEFEGVRWDIAFAQSIKETGYFKFTGDVPGLQNNNFAGIGAVGNGVQGATFPTPQEGIRAQIQHLKGYATTEPLKKPCVDPRYDILERNSMLGIAPNVEDLNDRWAAKDFTYGQEIMKLVEKMKAEVIVEKEEPKIEEPKKEEVKENIVDKIIKGFIKFIDWLFS